MLRPDLKHSIHIIPSRVLINHGLSVPPHHVVYSSDDVTHLFTGDEAVVVDVIQTEGPLQLLVKCTSRQHREADHKLLGNAQHALKQHK